MAYRSVDIGKLDVTAPANPGTPPMLQWLKLADLIVDEEYQREIGYRGWQSIRSIAAAFEWAKFGTVLVAPAVGGKFAIVDGQHRAHAAAACGFEEVPCQIVQIGRAEQAAAFAAVNMDSVKVTAWQAFKASLAAGEAWAREARDACAAAGCRLMTSNKSADSKQPGEIFAIKLIRLAIERGDAAGVTFALDGLKSSDAGADPVMWSDEYLRPWLNAVTSRPWLIAASADLRSFLDTFDIFAAEDRVNAWIREKRRAGIQTVAKHDMLAAEIGTALDARFSVKMKAVA